MMLEHMYYQRKRWRWQTNFTINLAIELSKLNNRVVIIDADLGLANIDVVLGTILVYVI